MLHEHFYYVSCSTSVRCRCPGTLGRCWVFCYQFHHSPPFCCWFSFVSVLLPFGFPLKSGWKYLNLWSFSHFLSYCLCPAMRGQKRAISSGGPRELGAQLSWSSSDWELLSWDIPANPSLLRKLGGLVVGEGAKFNCVTDGCSQVGSYTPVPGYSQARLGDGLRVACSVRQQDSFPKLSWGCLHCLGFSCWLLCWTGLVVNAEFRFPWQVLFLEIYSSAAFICQANALECRLTVQMWNLSSRKENKGLNVF